MSGLSEADVELHVCCLKPHLCRDEHFHQRDVERLIEKAVAAALTEAADAIEGTCVGGCDHVDLHAAARIVRSRIPT